MKIPKKMPQFEKPALFVVAGEYEAVFWLAFRGTLIEKDHLKMNPREEAKEKQGYVSKTKGKSLGATTHHERYREDLKKKIQKKIHRQIHNLISEYKLDEIYIFAPNYAIQSILGGLKKDEQKMVRMRFGKEYTRENPLKMLQEVTKEFQKTSRHIHKQEELFGSA